MKPEDTQPRKILRAEWYVLVAIFVVYVITRYPAVGGRVNMGDSAKFQFIGRVLGVGHAPGNPLYLMANALWTRVPLPLSDATKITILSSMFAMVTLVIILRVMIVLDRPPVITWPFTVTAPMFAVLLLAFGSIFWTLATEAEVYTLSSIFIALVILGVAKFTVRRERAGLFLATFAICFGLSNHLTIVALGPGLLFVVLRVKEGRRELTRPLLWIVMLGASALALAAYGYIAWRWSTAPLPYSEFPPHFDRASFVSFITAHDARVATYSRTTYAVAMFDRMPDVITHLQAQWAWPLLFLVPLGLWRLSRMNSAFAWFIVFATAGHFVLGIVFRIPDPEGLFLPVAVLLAVPLALVPDGVLLLKIDMGGEGPSIINGQRMATFMLMMHMMLITAHLTKWLRHPFTAYVQTTAEGDVVLNLPTLAEVAPENAIIAVPCGHYGCVEVVAYYRFANDPLREKNVTFGRFTWSEWDERIMPVPVLTPTGARPRPICVLLANDVKKLTDMSLPLRVIPREPAHVLGRTFKSAPLYCLDGK